MKVNDLVQRAELLESVIDKEHDDWKVLLYIQYLLVDMAKMPSTKSAFELKDDIVAMLCELESEHCNINNNFKKIVLNKGN